MKEYKILNVSANSKKNMIVEAEKKMNDMASKGWSVTTMTEFMAIELGYSMLIAFEKEK